jgi:predicted transcriptional regulator of viral defense system
MSSYKDIEVMIRENNGFITTTQITKAGIARRALSELVEQNYIYRVQRGIYALPETWEDEMYFLQYRFSKGVFSCGTALYLHGLTDRTPHYFTLSFPQGYNAAGLKKYNAKAKFVIPGIYELGIDEIASPNGNTLRVYNTERTLCDIVKGKNIYDIQLVNQAMKTYAESSSKNVVKLLEYAKILRVQSKVLRYMEVLV